MNEQQTIPDASSIWEARSRVINNRDFISVKPYSGYSLAIADPKAPEYLLKPDASDEELGEAILNALKHSRFLSYEEATELRANGKQNYDNWVQKIMSMYGYKTKKAMFKDMKSCGMSLHEGIITIRPSYHEKLEAWGGEGISEDDYVHISADSPHAEIGAALRLAFSRCTGMGS
jgi:hypothetical protein